MDNKELWVDIKDYPRYKISNLGRVRSFMRSDEILRTQVGSRGYVVVRLRKNRIEKSHLLHRLLAESFIPNPNFYKQVNHKDLNKLNNDLYNLEWCTQLYNISHAHKSGAYNCGESHYKCSITEGLALEIKKLKHAGKSVSEINSITNVKTSTIKSIVYNNAWSHINYIN